MNTYETKVIYISDHVVFHWRVSKLNQESTLYWCDIGGYALEVMERDGKRHASALHDGTAIMGGDWQDNLSVADAMRQCEDAYLKSAGLERRVFEDEERRGGE